MFNDADKSYRNQMFMQCVFLFLAFAYEVCVYVPPHRESADTAIQVGATVTSVYYIYIPYYTS